MQTQNPQPCGMCGRSLNADPKATALFGTQVHEACSKSFNQKRLNAVVVDIVIATVLLFVVSMNVHDSAAAAADPGGESMPVMAMILAGAFFNDQYFTPGAQFNEVTIREIGEDLPDGRSDPDRS